MGNIFYTKTDENFIEGLAFYFAELSRINPLELASYTLYLPSRRACLKLTQALQSSKISNNKTFALPKMYGLNDLETIALDHGFWKNSKHFALISPLQQTHLIARLLKEAKPDTTMTQALSLAKGLLSILNELNRENIDVNALKSASKGLFADHYAENVSLLTLVMDHYPKILAEWRVIDPLTYKKEVYSQLPSFWENRSNHHFIIAGITQYQKDSINLMKRAMNLSNTTLVLPFIDMHKAITSPSPPSPSQTSQHFHTHKIIGDLDVSPKSLPYSSRPSTTKSTTSITSVSPLKQAKELTQRVLNAIDGGHRHIAIVTPNRALATRVKAELSNYNLPVNDSSAISFNQIHEGTLILQAAKVLTMQTLPDYMVLLKHPLVFSERRTTHLDNLYTFETKLRSKPLLSTKLKDYDYPYKEDFNLTKGSYLTRLRDIIKQLSPNLFDDDTGDLIHKLFTDLQDVIRLHTKLSDFDLFEIVQHGLKTLSVTQPAYASDIHINIIGLMEARVECTDFMIITGLEEGTLPRTIDHDPWLSPMLRRTLGLATPDELIGLQAQDFFISLTGAPYILLSRCTSENGTPLLASRFWHQVDHEKQPLDEASVDYASNYIADIALPKVQEGYLQPPCPDTTLKPKKLSVSAIKLLMEDAYGFYAKYVLGLYRLWRFDEDAESLIFGQLLHNALDAYVKVGYVFAPSHSTFLQTFVLHHFKDTALTPMQKQRVLGFCTWLSHNTAPSEIATEVRLEKSITLGDVTFTIYGTADRIDFLDDQLHIIDYKTGAPPTQKAIAAGYAPQLPLEGWLQNPDSINNPVATQLMHIHILPKHPFADVLSVKDVTDRITEASEGVTQILTQYISPNFHFYPAPNPDNTPAHSDYAHLERQSA